MVDGKNHVLLHTRLLLLQSQRKYLQSAIATKMSCSDTHCGIDKFCAMAKPENLNSIKVMEKIGMTFSHEIEYKDNLYQEKVVVYTT